LKILLDHNLDRRLKPYFDEHNVSTTQENGWSDLVNGELLRMAEAARYKVIVTADSNIKSQKNIGGRSISILVLRSFNNRLTTHVEMVDDIKIALDQILDGEIVEVFHPDFAGKKPLQ